MQEVVDTRWSRGSCRHESGSQLSGSSFVGTWGGHRGRKERGKAQTCEWQGDGWGFASCMRSKGVKPIKQQL